MLFTALTLAFLATCSFALPLAQASDVAAVAAPNSRERFLVTRSEEEIADEDITWNTDNNYPPAPRSEPHEMSGEEKTTADEDIVWNAIHYPPTSSNN